MRRKFVSTALGFLIVVLPICSNAQQLSGREIIFPVTIQWNKQKAVTRYRLQIAADEEFENIYFDGRVSGTSYSVKDLSSGYYYWRVAPADQNRGNFSRPTRFFISGGVVMQVIVPDHSNAAAVRQRSH